MTLTEVLSELEAAGSEQTRKTYARHGVAGEMFGVSYATLEKLRKKIKVDQDLAVALWESGNHDARVLATKVADPARMTAKKLSSWVKDANNAPLAGAVATLASRSAGKECFEEWSRSKNDLVGSAGWYVLAELAGRSDDLPDDLFARELEKIEKSIHSAQNRTKYAMNGALIGIGCRNKVLAKKALQAADRIGKVEVDHGETGCKTPDARSYIEKVAARKKARG